MLWLLLTGLGGAAASLAVPLVVQRVVDGPVARGDVHGLLLLGALALLFGVVEAVLIFIRRWTHAAAAVGLEAAIRDDLYAHLQKLPVSFHDRWQSGQLLSRATSDLGVIRRFLSFGLIYLVVNTITYVTVIAMLFKLYWPLGLVVAASAVPLFVFARQFANGYLWASRALQEQQGDVATLVEETAAGLRTIRSFGRSRFMAGRFADEIGELRDIAIDKAGLLSRASAKFDLVPNLTLAVVLVVGSIAVAGGELTVGRLVAFASLQLLLIWPVESLGWIIANGQESMTAADRVFEVMDTPPAVTDTPHARAVAPGPGLLVLRDVHFRYPGTTIEVLRGVDLEVRPGETMAIVGVTGSGKTSLVSLVPRLYDATAGQITLDGTDLRDIRLDCLRELVGVAFEEPVLFSMSVRENITLGAPGATDAQIADALAVAQAGYVYDLPWGLDTRIGEQGLSLSGGQRQRLALARAVLARPRVLVLDDPLSALDVHTEALVDDALARVLKGTTALLVVHRPSTIALADRVALLADGRIAAVGTHSELLAAVPAYRAVLAAETAPVHGS
ncbi:ATP-binding cassette subfamily B protein [Catenuloplanes nepalensis]|uniref:ATP-binding cassette subfamily B protein n=1 Tax=Catenuloplanes nepalensis TaxID=587533 RepID=A0ABT9N220_9ACTN|nr:ABC transporter ATP-binding protein [Catenuloplanes nepalensis]MDP9797726.1 ATP-binding cassette subfamily B protein [Catenuloplanes nepalensis]